jgi:hypothetical protein
MISMRKHRNVYHLFVVSLLMIAVMISGCSALFSSAASNFAENLSFAFENNSDVAVVEDGAPAYLIMLDALVIENPDDYSILRTSAKLNAAYAELFVDSPERLKILTQKAIRLALDSTCMENAVLCGLRDKNFEEFENAIKNSKKKDLDALYVLGSVWAGWIQANKRDWNAVAELSRVETIMRRTVELDPLYKNGEPFLYLGALATMLPPALGGKPEEGRRLFERAIEISEGKNLYAKYLLADRYARLVFDRQLHDRLLTEIVQADPIAEGFTLSNTIARKKAENLLKTADDFF